MMMATSCRPPCPPRRLIVFVLIIGVQAYVEAFEDRIHTD